MPLRYAKQSTSYIIGDSDTAATLTEAYSGNQTSFPTPEFDRAVLYVEYTPAASARNLYVQVEGAPVDGDFFKGGGNQFNVNAKGSQLSLDVRAPELPGSPRFYYQNDFFGSGGGELPFRVRQLY